MLKGLLIRSINVNIAKPEVPQARSSHKAGSLPAISSWYFWVNSTGKIGTKERRYATYVVIILLEMNSITYLYAMNSPLRQRRERFINDILKVNTNFIKLDKKNLF